MISPSLWYKNVKLKMRPSSICFCFSANEVIQIPNPVGDLFVFSDSTCSDEESNLYFEGVTWFVSDCIKCECSRGLISCVKAMTFLTSTIVHIEHCNQPNCNIVAFLNSHKHYCQGKHMSRSPITDRELERYMVPRFPGIGRSLEMVHNSKPQCGKL